MGEDQLIDVFKSVGQVIGFRYCFTTFRFILTVVPWLNLDLLCHSTLDWYLTGTQANPKVTVFVNSRVHQFILFILELGLRLT